MAWLCGYAAIQVSFLYLTDGTRIQIKYIMDKDLYIKVHKQGYSPSNLIYEGNVFNISSTKCNFYIYFQNELDNKLYKLHYDWNIEIREVSKKRRIVMEEKNAFEKTMSMVNELFSKIFAYNCKLLKLCNDENYNPTFAEIFDFYITSNAMSFLKNFYCQFIESPGILLNGRCIIEGLAIKAAYENKTINNINVELLKKQDAIIEYRQYKKFKEIMAIVSIPDETKNKYEEAVNYYKTTLKTFTDKEVDSIINSQIPFLCNPKMTYRKLIEDNLGKEMAEYYSVLSIFIHPRSNEMINMDLHTTLLLDIVMLINEVYGSLPGGDININYLLYFITHDKDAEMFNDLIKAECTQMEIIQADFKKNFGDNYTSDTFHMISMLIQEMMFDTIFGMTEQVKSKFKVMLELLASYHEVYLVQEDVENSFRLLQYHEDASISRSCNDRNGLDEVLKKAYVYYKKKYPNGVDFEQFSHKYVSNVGFTIDEDGNVKTINQLVNSLCNLFEDSVSGIKTSDVLKLNYVEAQMLSHANGYMWYANSGAWGNTFNVYTNINRLISYICIYMSNIYKNGYKETKEYKDKKTSNVLKHAGIFIRDNNKSIAEILYKKESFLYETITFPIE